MNIEVKKVLMSKEVLEEIIALDREFYTNYNYREEWYLKRYGNREVTVLIIDGVIRGYYCFYNITEQLYNDIISLKYSDDYDFSDEQVYVDSDIYYLPSVVVKSEYRGNSLMLLRQLVKDFKSKEKIVAIAVSDEGRRMCDKFMQYVGSPDGHSLVYKK